MFYDTKKNKYTTGQRIREQRLAAGYRTQSSFALALGLQEESRQSVGAWENDNRLPTLDIFLKMCELFDCEIGYLLCEYDCKTREITDIQQATGLSEKSIQRLFMLRKRTKETDRFTFDSPINSIIENDAFVELIEAIKKHVWSFNHNHNGIENINDEIQEALSNTFNCEPYELKGYIEMSSQSLIESLIMKIVRDIE